jgi:hypothetical protein
MKTKHAFFAAAILSMSASAFAQPSLNVPLPGAAPQNAPLPVAATVAAPIAHPKGPAGDVDKVLERIAKNMQPQGDVIDQQAEANINRDLNLSRSTGQLLRPVGYLQVGDERSVFASEDGVRVLRLREQSRLGVMRIAKISEDGVEYKVSGKDMYAPLAYTAQEAPKVSAMPTPVPGQAQSGAGQAQGALGGNAPTFGR